ncbi:Gfo/Idh/MocA family protein [Aliiruegeria sabulilitoris]|uniref:Gfo/Idh/MocA family protein n=1 Tax=Aliiruegeria sabulilitoris TaxID=1510458 RepID=UPI00083421DA|nr:Gfo/Idh/MocA family oxidoreductase [Aliiruegeria sabulilitoris]NDR58827.1 Gfo/Idh/MocA family oxidoreductase [Pseudoruegeria sp. M32A2M]
MALFPDNLNFDGPFPRLSRRLRLGIVGGGRIAATQAMAARMSDHWEVVAGALSSNQDSARSRAAEFRIAPDRAYVSFEEMAAAETRPSEGVDAVMITTPNHLHHAAARAFLNAGIDVLCDKPLTNEVSEAEDLVGLTSASGCVFGVSYVMSCFPMIRQARQIVSEGGLGRINQIHVEFLQDWMTPEEVADAPHVKWRLDPSKTGKTSCVGDIGTHAAHLAQFVSGLPLTDLRAEFHVCGAPKPVEDTFFAWTRHAGEVPGTLMATRLAPGNRGGLRLRIFGSEGGIEWDLEKAEQLRFNRFGEADRIISRGHGHGVSPTTERLVRTGRGFPEGIIEAWGNLYTEFAMAVAARKDGLRIPEGWLGMPTVADGANGVRFIEATVRSNQAGGEWVEL